MVEKGILAHDRHFCIELMDNFNANLPNSTTNSHQAFRIELTHQLVQSLVSLKASPENPLSLSTNACKPVSIEKRLTGKHFPYKQKMR